MVYNTEIAPTAHTYCTQCRKKIKGGEMRLRRTSTNDWTYVHYDYYCNECGQTRIKYEIIELKELSQELENDIRKND